MKRAVPMGTLPLVLAALACAGFARADCLEPLPATLPLNSLVTATTCPREGNESCNWRVYPSPATSARFTIDKPSIVNIALSGVDTFGPALYLSGGVCDEGECGPELPAGSYCATVTASAESAIGSCGCFDLFVQTAALDILYEDGFD